MTLFELLFIALFLVSAGCLLLCAALWRTGKAKKLLMGLVSVWAAYLVLLAVADVLRVPKVFKVGEEECFDEMCFAVIDQADAAQAPTAGAGRTLKVVTMRATSRSEGRAQAEGGLRGRLYGDGRYLEISASAQRSYEAEHGPAASLTDRIAPGESKLAVLVFEVPEGVGMQGLVLDHGFTPGYFVIGESPFFHQPDVHLLP
jgi:hypothetical protein